MGSTIGAAATDLSIDAFNIQNQSEDDGNSSRPGLLRTLLPGAAVWAGFGIGDHLRDTPFNKNNRSLLRTMKRVGNVDARREVAANYFARNTARIAEVEKISSKAAFTSAAEKSFMRFSAGTAIRGAATLANVGLFIAPQLYGMMYHGFKGIKKLGYELETPGIGGHFVLNSAQATDRQRALMAMHNSEFNGRSAIGNEAALLHN